MSNNYSISINLTKFPWVHFNSFRKFPIGTLLKLLKCNKNWKELRDKYSQIWTS